MSLAVLRRSPPNRRDELALLRRALRVSESAREEVVRETVATSEEEAGPSAGWHEYDPDGLASQPGPLRDALQRVQRAEAAAAAAASHHQALASASSDLLDAAMAQLQESASSPPRASDRKRAVRPPQLAAVKAMANAEKRAEAAQAAQAAEVARVEMEAAAAEAAAARRWRRRRRRRRKWWGG